MNQITIEDNKFTKKKPFDFYSQEYTKLNPLVVLIGKGEHQVTSSWSGQDGYERQTKRMSDDDQTHLPNGMLFDVHLYLILPRMDFL